MSCFQLGFIFFVCVCVCLFLDHMSLLLVSERPVNRCVYNECQAAATRVYNDGSMCISFFFVLCQRLLFIETVRCVGDFVHVKKQ